MRSTIINIDSIRFQMEKNELYQDIGQYEMDIKKGKTTLHDFIELKRRFEQLMEAVKHSYWDKLVCTASPDMLRFYTYSSDAMTDHFCKTEAQYRIT